MRLALDHLLFTSQTLEERSRDFAAFADTVGSLIQSARNPVSLWSTVPSISYVSRDKEEVMSQFDAFLASLKRRLLDQESSSARRLLKLKKRIEGILSRRDARGYLSD